MSKDQDDPYSHFWIHEAGKIERIYQVKDEEMKEYEDFAKTTTNQ